MKSIIFLISGAAVAMADEGVAMADEVVYSADVAYVEPTHSETTYPSQPDSGDSYGSTPVYHGTPGHQGPPGQPGARGHPGARGKQGAPGKRGYPGRPGKRGGKGLPGANGNPGHDGPMGYQGPQGPRGRPGARGNRGPQGPDGAPAELKTVTCVSSSCQDDTCTLECGEGYELISTVCTKEGSIVDFPKYSKDKSYRNHDERYENCHCLECSDPFDVCTLICHGVCVRKKDEYAPHYPSAPGDDYASHDSHEKKPSRDGYYHAAH